MLRRIIKEEIFLLEDDTIENNIKIHNGIYKSLLFENDIVTWCCIDVDRIVYTHNKRFSGKYWLTIQSVLEELYNRRILAENRNSQIDEILNENRTTY